MDQQETSMPAEQPKASSLTTRIANVFASPSELFGEVAAKPVQKSSWVVPYLVTLVLVLLVTYLLFLNDSLRNQIFDMQVRGMKQAVEQGRMSAEQLDRAEEQMRQSGLGMFMIFGGVSQIVVISIMFFGMALFVWLAGKFVLKAQAGYGKWLEVTGLVTWVGLLGTVVTVLLMYAMDSLHASPGLGLAVMGSYDPDNKVHTILSQLNVFTLWETALIGFALSKISGKTMGAGMGVAFALWVIWVIIAVSLGLGMR